MEWQRNGELFDLIETKRRANLGIYRNSRDRLREDSEIEQAVVSGGYTNRQVRKLLQNAVDANIGTAEEVRLLGGLEGVHEVREDLVRDEGMHRILVEVLGVSEPTEEDWVRVLQEQLDGLLNSEQQARVPLFSALPHGHP